MPAEQLHVVIPDCSAVIVPGLETLRPYYRKGLGQFLPPSSLDFLISKVGQELLPLQGYEN